MLASIYNRLLLVLRGKQNLWVYAKVAADEGSEERNQIYATLGLYLEDSNCGVKVC